MKKSTYNPNQIRNKFNSNFKQQPQDFSILPPLALLENYEEMAPGITKKLMDMMEAEQENRHKRQDHYLKSKTKAIRFGQFCNLVIVGLLIYGIVLISSINIYLAGTVGFLGFGFLLIVHLKAMKYYSPENEKKKYYRNHGPNSIAK